MAESNGLLNRHTVNKPYRGFESLPLRSIRPSINSGLTHGEPCFDTLPFRGDSVSTLTSLTHYITNSPLDPFDNYFTTG